MKNYIKVISLFAIILFSASCVPTSQNFAYRYKYARHQRIVKRIMNKSYKQNGNAFYLCSEKEKFCWTYDKNKVDFFYFENFTKCRKETFDRGDSIDFSNLPKYSNVRNSVIEKCFMFTDGPCDDVVIMINDKGTLFQFNFLCRIECIRSNTYKYDLLNEIVKDINRYGFQSK